MQLTRNQFFAALFAPLLAALGLKPAAKVYRTIMYGFRTTKIETAYGSFVMVDNQALRNHATDT